MGKTGVPPTRSLSPPKQPAQAGRPRMGEASNESNDEDALRKARMRRDQRTYRAKKANTLLLAQERSARLEEALCGIIDSFNKLQDNLTHDAVSPSVAMHLNKAALQIACFSTRSGIQKLETARAGKDVKSCAGLVCASRIVGDRLIRASMHRTANMIAAGYKAATCLPPNLLDELSLYPDEHELNLGPNLGQRTSQISNHNSSRRLDVKFPKPFGNNPPLLFRQIEGGLSEMMPRLPPPQLQRLKFGHTRTWVETSLPGLAGEWLEAIDVEEYLAERGITLRPDPESALITLKLNPATNANQFSCNNDRQIDCLLNVGSAAQSNAQRLSSLATDIMQSGREATDWSVFGKQMHKQHSIPSGVWEFAPSLPFWADDKLKKDLMSHGVEIDTMQINVDKLIEGLALRAICIGSSPGIKRESVDVAIREAVVRVADEKASEFCRI